MLCKMFRAMISVILLQSCRNRPDRRQTERKEHAWLKIRPFQKTGALVSRGLSFFYKLWLVVRHWDRLQAWGPFGALLFVSLYASH